MTLRAQGIERESRGDLEGALDAYTRAVAADPTEPEFHHRRAQVFLRLNRKAEAEAEAAERKRLREAHDDLRKAWDRLGDAWDRDPNRIEPTLLHGMARASERAGRGREAAAWFHQVLLRLPADQEAIAAVERLRPVDPDPPR